MQTETESLSVQLARAGNKITELAQKIAEQSVVVGDQWNRWNSEDCKLRNLKHEYQKASQEFTELMGKVAK